MPGIAEQGTTFNLPNYVGELFAVTPTDTPFLSAIGGLTGGERANATLFQWQGYDLRDADENRQRLEGAPAPNAEQRVRFNVSNVVEIHQEAVEVTYTKQAATGQFNSTGSTHPGSVGLAGTNPVLDELDWQVQRHLEQIARDVERSFIVGEFANPGTNATPRKTRGILQATASNAQIGTGSVTKAGATIDAATDLFTFNAHGLANDTKVTVSALTGGAVGVLKPGNLYYVVNATANTFQLALTQGGAPITFTANGGADVSTVVVLTKTMILNLLQQVWENGGIQVSETATLMCNGTLKRALTKIFITDARYQEQSRTVGGVHVMTIETDFGVLNVMLNRHMPQTTLQVASLEQCAPAMLEIPGKGFLFQEPLGREGAADRQQIYGEIGLKYGNERTHGKLLNVTAGPDEPAAMTALVAESPATDSGSSAAPAEPGTAPTEPEPELATTGSKRGR